ncbi:piggyBac transposable element-derived protein 3-like [Phymastichus coffea]|uniref:piggyBac transposable element-derived protein 3-like n=1 Tax=Phymastichus coffea TaxID=108790 RepID=UPI00273B7861|nr:piggyBac transposable element-derived protein 3-like [Phymastichus coffea]
MLQRLLTTVSPRKISRYHIYFDNFFSSPDLFVHLRKIGFRATGTVRANRVSGVTIDLNNKSKRGTYFVKHDKNSGVNYISVMDSKIVSLLSTACGITPLSSAKRYSKDEHGKVEIPCPYAFNLYNNFMGGVDQHDYYCSSLLPCIRSKKWT